MSRTPKTLAPDLHISFADLDKVTPDDLLGIDGPKFITHKTKKYHHKTLAVLISHDRWRTLNHNLPDVNPRKATLFFVGGQRYVTIPVEDDGHQVWQAKPETGLKIITVKTPKPRRVSN